MIKPSEVHQALLNHINGDESVAEIVVGAFLTAVLLNTRPPLCGIASSMREYDCQEGPQVAEAGNLLNYSALELAELIYSRSVMEASIGMAAINALLQKENRNYLELNARDLILQKALNKRVAVVGHFPFIEKIREIARESWVLELRPRPGDYPAETASQFIPLADVVVLTGTTLINHTFDSLISLCQPSAFLMLVGGSTPLTPVLFEFGIHVISGTHIIKPFEAVKAISQGATFRQIPGRKMLTLMKTE